MIIIKRRNKNKIKLNYKVNEFKDENESYLEVGKGVRWKHEEEDHTHFYRRHPHRRISPTYSFL
jgi:hypothetical protein